MDNKIIESLDKIISPIARTKSSHAAVFSDFCKMSACALAMQTREKECLEVTGGYTREELDTFGKGLGELVNTMQENPYKDILGVYYLEIASKFSKKDRGEFYTPDCIASLMSRMLVTADTILEKGLPVTINDPACGSGNMILALAETLSPDGIDLMRVTGQDISPIACDMFYINTTLWGIPAKVILGNTLTMEIQNVWTNLHWHRVGENYREIFRRIVSPKETKNPNPTPREGQMSFEW